MKRITAFVAAAIMVFGGAAYLPSQQGISIGAVISASAEGDYDFTEGAYQCANLDDGTVKIVKYTGADVTLTLPTTLGGKKVTEVGSFAFDFNKTLVTVTVPDGYVTFHDRAFFDCQVLETINMPSTLKKIDNSCFWGCEKLKKAIVPDSVDQFDGLVFSNCPSLIDVKLPSGLTEIPGYTFNNCTSLNRFEIPAGVTSIQNMSFVGCTSLKSLTIPAGAKIDSHAVGFYYKDNDYKLIDGFTMYVTPNSPAEEYAKKYGVNYKYTGSQQPEPPATGVKGDVNGDGDVNVSDISKVAAHVKGIKSLSGDELDRADVNGDGVVQVNDISPIAAHVKGKKSL